MKNLVSIEKKKYIFNQYVEPYDMYSVYDLVMELLDNSYFENGDIKEMMEVCEFCFQILMYIQLIMIIQKMKSRNLTMTGWRIIIHVVNNFVNNFGIINVK